MDKKIIDSHVHIYPDAIAEKACVSLGKFYDFTVYGKGTYDDYCSQAEKCGITGMLLFSVATSAHQVKKINDTVTDLVAHSRSQGFESVGFGAMHQDFPDFRAEAERIAELGLKGIKIHPDIQAFDLSNKLMYELCEIIEGKLILFLHMGDNRPEYRFSEPKKLAKLMDRFPNLKVVAAHLGGYCATNEAEKYLYGRKNIAYDCSSSLQFMSAEKATECIRKCGTENVFFGTDYPVCNIDTYLELFDRLELDEEERNDIFYNNVKRFIYLS